MKINLAGCSYLNVPQREHIDQVEEESRLGLQIQAGRSVACGRS